jgi:hypothetical protein
LYNKKDELAMTYLLELSLIKKVCQTAVSYKCNLTRQSGPSTQADTISPVKAENEEVTEESDNEEDADWLTDDDEYDQICETDATDANRASDEEDYDKYWRRPGV